MLKRLAAAVLFALAFPASAQLLDTEAQQVELLAPQLVPFAGSGVNFSSLALGLTQGIPVTLTTTGRDGVVQIATFDPGAALTPTQAASALEAARQDLIALGIVRPTALELATALIGGQVATGAGLVPVGGVLPGMPGPLQVRNEFVDSPLQVAGTPLTLGAASPFDRQTLRAALGGILPTGLTGFEVDRALELASTLLLQQGIVAPSIEQLRAALVGGTVVNAAGFLVPLRGALEGAGARDGGLLPLQGYLSSSPYFGTSDSPTFGVNQPSLIDNLPNVRPPNLGARRLLPGSVGGTLRR